MREGKERWAAMGKASAEEAKAAVRAAEAKVGALRSLVQLGAGPEGDDFARLLEELEAEEEPDADRPA